MAAEEEPASRNDDPSTASDALSLHTITEADAYASQEQADADFALALALEEQENERFTRDQGAVQDQQSIQAATQPSPPIEAQVDVNPPPYRDDPDVPAIDENPPPYRDDPEIVPAVDEADEANVEHARRTTAAASFLRKLCKAWLCLFAVTTFVVIAIIVAAAVLLFVHGKTPPLSREASKEAAWKSSGSTDYSLKLAKLYPAMEDGADGTCRNNWKKLPSLSCHRMILSSVWDGSDAAEVSAAGADPLFYRGAVCTLPCIKDISAMLSLGKNCAKRTDRFDFAAYERSNEAYFETGELSEGPLHVAIDLAERYGRLCNHKRAWGQSQTDWGTCAADMWMNWGIADGKTETDLTGLDLFIEKTSVKATIPGGTYTFPVLLRSGGNATKSIQTNPRSIGPGDGETDCSTCTMDWFERKLHSFEFGQVLDPATGQTLGLSEFRQRIKSAMSRCRQKRKSQTILEMADARWTALGWWDGDKPAKPSIDKPHLSNDTLAILHGWSEDHEGLSRLRELTKRKDVSTTVLQASQVLYDSMMTMPCGIGFDPITATYEIMPHEHIVGRLCSDRCRNPLDRLAAQHGALFAKAERDREHGQIFKYPVLVREMMDNFCLSTTPDYTIFSTEHLCAPGYSALSRPDWIWVGGVSNGLVEPPSRAHILDVFSTKIKELDDYLQAQPYSCKGSYKSCKLTRQKLAAMSACNTCAGKLFIGVEGEWKKTTEEFLGDASINGTEYVTAAKKGWRTCAALYNLQFSEAEWKDKWKTCGLDVYD